MIIGFLCLMSGLMIRCSNSLINSELSDFDGTVLMVVAPQLTVIMNTTAQSDVEVYTKAARAAWEESNEGVAREMTTVPGRSNSDR
jgi:hypothetical protein